MSFHVLAFQNNPGAATTYAAVPGIVDQFAPLNASSNYIMPIDYKLLAAYGLGANITAAQIQTPSLRSPCTPNVSPLEASATPITIPSVMDLRPYGPTVPATDEIKYVTSVSATGQQFGLIWIGTGVMNVPPGKIFPIRFTTAFTSTAFQWTAGTISFDQTLQAGKYSVVGMMAFGANAIAARLVFPGGGPRPGCIAPASVGIQGWDQLRSGRFGEYGQFIQTAPPTIEVLGTTGGVANIGGVLDLIKIA
jgi:hypothetical protein